MFPLTKPLTWKVGVTEVPGLVVHGDVIVTAVGADGGLTNVVVAVIETGEETVIVLVCAVVVERSVVATPLVSVVKGEAGLRLLLVPLTVKITAVLGTRLP